MAEIKAICFNCEKKLDLLQGFSRREECPHCHADVHSCKNCTFYDINSYNECREPSADVVKEKDRANYCDYFKISDDMKTSGSEKQDLLAAAEALFSKKDS